MKVVRVKGAGGSQSLLTGRQDHFWTLWHHPDVELLPQHIETSAKEVPKSTSLPRCQVQSQDDVVHGLSARLIKLIVIFPITKDIETAVEEYNHLLQVVHVGCRLMMEYDKTGSFDLIKPAVEG